MEELIRTNDMVLISFAESLLKEAGIVYLLADQNMSVIEGSLGVLPRRILVDADSFDEARRLMTDAGIGDELRPKGRDRG
ncbi:MAG: DUF2007 domain-containing protein [Bosea sp.]|nr:DUF2007 domain-containing protein [Bosea sp. (in: a-proteobacteria)]